MLGQRIEGQNFWETVLEGGGEKEGGREGGRGEERGVETGVGILWVFGASE